MSGGNHVLGGLGAPDPARSDDLQYLLGETGRRHLYGAAARLAYAIESIDRAAFAGRSGVRYDLETAAGWIRIRDAADDVYEDDGSATLLLVDLGGDDVHRDPAGSNRYNLNLSQRRARSVRDYLVAQGLTTDQLNTVGYGETRLVTPRAWGDQPGAEMNRRVVFVIETASQKSVALAQPETQP
jgi:hypothetical protein